MTWTLIFDLDLNFNFFNFLDVRSNILFKLDDEISKIECTGSERIFPMLKDRETFYVTLTLIFDLDLHFYFFIFLGCKAHVVSKFDEYIFKIDGTGSERIFPHVKG